MVSNVNVFSTRVIITVLGKRDSGLIVIEKSDWLAERFEHLADETAEP